MATAVELLEAARDGDLEKLSKLLQKGTDRVNAQVPVNGSHTPLTAACWFGQLDSVKCLLEHDADPTATGGEDNLSPLHVAATFGHTSIVRHLLDECGRVTVNDRTEAGETALDFALEQSHQEVVELLVERGGTAKRRISKQTTKDESDEDAADDLPPDLRHLLNRG